MYCPDLEPTEDCPSPPLVVDGFAEPVIDSASSGYSTCALLESGRIVCWGENTWGQLGDGTTEDRDFPTLVVGLDDVVVADVVMRSRSTCALAGDGRVYCWGNNEKGQVGNGHLPSTLAEARVSEPSEVEGLPEKIAGLSMGGEHACAIGEAGSIYCWGNNMDGQLGNGEGESDECYQVEDYPNCYHPTPVRVVGFGPEPEGGWPEPPGE
jgi:alpha-tubulin suppressor-like RCC1 family protein